MGELSHDHGFWIMGNEDVQYKQVNRQALVHGDTSQEYFPMNELSLSLISQVKMASSLWQVAKIN